MYFVKYNGEYLHDPRTADLVLHDLDFEGGENEASLCSFTMSCFHPLHDEIVERTSSRLVEVFDDRLGEEDPYFVGYVYEVGDAFDLQRTVKCKGELAFFNDSIVRPYTTQGNADVSASPGVYFEWLVQEHNAQVERAKQFSVGINQASDLDTNDYVLRADTTYPNTGEVIKSKLLEKLGGVLRVRYEGGKRYVDYLAEWSDKNTQTFEFGVNLTDFSKTDDALDVATFVVPLGANMKDTAYDYDDGYFVTSDAKPVKNKEYFVRSFKKCGAMTAFADGVTYWEKKETDYFKTSDTKPFSGVDYYCKVFTKVNISKFASGKTYYRLIDGVYTKVTGSYNKNYTYYTMKWEKQSVSKFDEDKTYWEKETYYARTSDSAPKSGKDYYTLNRGSYSSKKDIGRFLKYETYYEYKEANDESQRRLTVDKLANGPWDGDIEKIDDYVYSRSAVEKYGWIGATVEDSDIKLRNNLLYAGVMALKAAISPATTIEVKAVDLSLVNPEFKPIRVGEYVRVKSRPHGFDSYMLCTSVKLDLNNPQNSEYTLGTVFDKLSGQQNKRIRSLNSTIDKVYERAEAISAEAKAEAVEAIEEAKKAQTEAVVANDAMLFIHDNLDEVVSDVVEAQATADVAQAEASEAKETATVADAKAVEAKGVAEAADAKAVEAKSTATEAKNAADKAQGDVNTLTTRVVEAEAGIKEYKDSIGLYAKKTEVTEALGGYYTKAQTEAAIDVKTDAITSTVSSVKATADAAKAAVDGLEIGGRNHAALSSLKRYVGGNLFDETPSYSVEGTRITASGQPVSGPLPGFKVHTDGAKEFTVSGYSDLASVRIYFKCFDSEGAETSAQIGLAASPDADGRFVRSFDNVAEGTAYFHIGIGNDTVSDYYLDRLKIEKGNLATDWTPAPEDMATVEQMNSAIEQKADSITSTVSKTYATQEALGTTNENVTSAAVAAARAQQTADSIVQLIISTDRSTTLRNPTDTLTATANVFRHGQRLTEEEVAELGTVRWYVNGLPVENKTGLTCTINACSATLKARLEAN